jgi:two-component system phosphate regulon sensor histidine kinase PhoR
VKLGVRSKLFAASLVLVLASIIAAGLFLESELRRRLEHNVELELARIARASREIVAVAGVATGVPSMSELADRLGEATGARITIIDRAGTVVGDSDVADRDLAGLDNHAGRPEIREALATGAGTSKRWSSTVDSDLMYVALVLGPDHPGWVVRVARPLQEIDAAIRRLRKQIAVACLIGLLAAVLMSALASHWMVRALRALAETARAVARGEARGRVDVASHDEIGRLAGSVNELAANVEATVAALAAERSRLETVLEGMSDAVVALDANRDVTLMNSAALKMLRLRKTPVGRSFVDLIRVPAVHELLAAVPSAGIAEFELDGQRRILARVTPNRGAEGTVIVMQNVTALRKLETIRRDFVANVSHELRTPVSIVQANTETLLEGALDDPAQARRLLEALHRNAARMARLIADLLDLSRLEAGRHELASEAVSIRTAAERAVDAIGRTAQTKSTAVEIDAPAELAARADTKALDQVLVNLLENAVKYSPERSHVVLSAREHAGGVRIEVRDDGPGIPEAHHERIFERFYRVDPGRSQDMGGTGLGLSIVKHLVEGMDGSIGMTSADPNGCVFWVELPAAR